MVIKSDHTTSQYSHIGWTNNNDVCHLLEGCEGQCPHIREQGTNVNLVSCWLPSKSWDYVKSLKCLGVIKAVQQCLHPYIYTQTRLNGFLECFLHVIIIHVYTVYQYMNHMNRHETEIYLDFGRIIYVSGSPHMRIWSSLA